MHINYMHVQLYRRLTANPRRPLYVNLVDRPEATERSIKPMIIFRKQIITLNPGTWPPRTLPS